MVKAIIVFVLINFIIPAEAWNSRNEKLQDAKNKIEELEETSRKLKSEIEDLQSEIDDLE